MPEGATILQACKSIGIETPTLCYLETLTPVNVCRVCVVEVEGSRVLVPACSRQVEPGMVIQTDSERVRVSRRLVFELLGSSVDLSLATPEFKQDMARYDAKPERFDAGHKATDAGVSAGSSRRRFLGTTIAAAGVAWARPLQGLAWTQTPASSGWNAVPGILARIVPPRFRAARSTSRDSAPSRDGTADCTQAIAQAIAACAPRAADASWCPPGAFLTGAIHLREQREPPPEPTERRCVLARSARVSAGRSSRAGKASS